MGWIALGFALLAAASRMQMAILVPIIAVALLADVASQGRGWRERLSAHRWPIAAAAAITIAGSIVVLADQSVLGIYAGLGNRSNLSGGVPLTGKQALAFIAMAGVLPFILALATSLRIGAWRDPRVRALLIVFWTATVVLILQTGLLSSGLSSVTFSIERYVEYSLPVLYVLVVASLWNGFVEARLVALATLAVSAVLLLTPGIQNIQEQRGIFGLARRADQLLGISIGPAMALVALLVGGATTIVLILARHRSGRLAALAAATIATGLVFAVQDQAGWAWQQQQARVWREGFPRDLSWIDHASSRPVARLVSFYNPYRTPQTEFFNDRITRVYVFSGPIGGAPVLGKTCAWDVDAGGAVRFAGGCGPAPTRFFLNDDLAKTTFYDQRVITTAKDQGRIVDVNPRATARPRLKAVILPACTAPIATEDRQSGDVVAPRPQCRNVTSGFLYLDAFATLALRFQGSKTPQKVQFASTWTPSPVTFKIPAGRSTTIRLPVPSGAQRYNVTFGWQGSPPGVPSLTSTALTQGGTTQELLY
jgi:hypothetical protein